MNTEGQVVAGERMGIGLSADHRVVDGAIGAQYLAQLRQLLEGFHLGDRVICQACYEGCGSCCPEFGKDDLWQFPDHD